MPVLVESLRQHKRLQAEQRLLLGPAWANLDLVFCTLSGGALRPSTVSKDFSSVVRALEDAEMIVTRGATFHSLRHTHATLLLRARVPVHAVSRRLRHANPADHDEVLRSRDP